MSKIAIVGRSPVFSNGIISTLKKESQLFSYHSIPYYRLSDLDIMEGMFQHLECLVFLADYRKDLVRLDKIWIKAQMNLVVISDLNPHILQNYCKRYNNYALLGTRIAASEFARCVERVFMTKSGEELEIIRTSDAMSRQTSNDYDLTKREFEILNLISQSLSNKEIASTLYISDHTVSVHRKNLMRKLSVNNAAGLVTKAFRERLIEF